MLHETLQISLRLFIAAPLHLPHTFNIFLREKIRQFFVPHISNARNKDCSRCIDIGRRWQRWIRSWSLAKNHILLGIVRPALHRKAQQTLNEAKTDFDGSEVCWNYSKLLFSTPKTYSNSTEVHRNLYTFSQILCKFKHVIIGLWDLYNYSNDYLITSRHV